MNPDGTPSGGFDSHEVIAGTDNNDWIEAGNGDDSNYGDDGNDYLNGNAGADHIYGGDGDDVIFGGDIEDFLDGGEGDDIIFACTSAGALDVVIGGAGNDKFYGEAGIDEIYGGAGDDYIDAGSDTDLAFGDSGNDEMYGGDGPDELRGGTGDDILSGGTSADKLLGETGDDIIRAGVGQSAGVGGDSDEALGDVGFDMVSFDDVTIALNVAADLRNQGIDAANGAGITPEPFNQLWLDIEGIIGSGLNDTLYGEEAGTGADPLTDGGDNWLIGGSGADNFWGLGGNDVLIGDSIRLDTLIGTYSSGHGSTVNGASHRATGSLSAGLLGNAAKFTDMFALHYTDLLKSERFKDTVFGEDAVSTASLGDVAHYNNKLVNSNGTQNYNITVVTFGAITALKIVDLGNGTVNDRTDLAVGIETFDFNGVQYSMSQLLNQQSTALSFSGSDYGTGATLDAFVIGNTLFDQDNTSTGGGIYANDITLSWQTRASNAAVWSTFADPLNAVAGTTNLKVRVVADYVDQALNHETLTSAQWNLIVGTTGKNTLNCLVEVNVIFGLNGNDTLNGNNLADMLYGGVGNDTMSGGDGNDTYYVDTTSEGVVESLDMGTDAVFATVSFTLGNNVENLTLEDTGNINGTGNGLDNNLAGNSGNNILDGKAGNDVMTGGAGDDTYFVSEAGDMVSETAGGGNDTVKTTLASRVLSADVENLIKTNAGAFTGWGNLQDNTITGNCGVDTLYGRDGSDTLYGKNGGDFLDGESGNDILNGGGGLDTLTGGLGNDQFIMDTTNSCDTILDFNNSTEADLIGIKMGVFTGVVGDALGNLDVLEFFVDTGPPPTGNGVPNAPEQRIIYNFDTGRLTYDSNGSVSGGTVDIVAVLAPHLALAHDDFFVFVFVFV